MQAAPLRTYAPESIGSVMSVRIPTCSQTDTLGEILRHMASKKWHSISNVYVLDHNQKILGFIDMTALIQSDHGIKARTLMRPIAISLHPAVDQEEAVFFAVKDDVVSIPVVDDDGTFLGAITAHKIIDIMHDEHIEDALLVSGVRRKSGREIAKLATERTSLIVTSRTPWLVVGLIVGMGLGVISSLFEEALQETVALAYFIPLVAYIAGSVGTQSGAIAVRALATLKINNWAYLYKEVLVGMALGVIVGMLGGLGGAAIAGDGRIGIVVGLSLFAASTVAAVCGSLIPFIFKASGRDPAIGSGPIATAVQDVISVLIYFLFASLLI